MSRRAAAIAMACTFVLAGALALRPILLAPIPAVLALGILYVVMIAVALVVRWWSLQILATLTLALSYAIALAAGPDHLDLLAPVVAAGVALMFEAIELVHGVRAGMSLRRMPALARLSSAGFAASAGLVGGTLVILTGAALHVTAAAPLALAAVAGLVVFAILVTNARRATI